MATVNVMGVACPIFIKNNRIIVKGANGKECEIFQHDCPSYVQYRYEGYLMLGLTIREQALITFSDKAD